MSKAQPGYQAREREIVARHKVLFRALGIKVIKTSGQGEPDLVGSIEGFAFAIEVKQEGRKPTKLQEVRIKEWRASGAVAFYSDNPVESILRLEEEIDLKRNEIVGYGPYRRKAGEMRIPSKTAPLYVKDKD